VTDLRPRFFRLTAINILSSVTVPLVGLVDTAMLGHLPDIRFLAGVALAAIIFDYLYWTLGFLRMGTTGTTAQAVGRDDGAEACRVLYRSLIVAFAVAAFLLVFQTPLRELAFGALSGEAGVEDAGRDYYDARIWGAPAALANFTLVGWFLGRESSKLVLIMTVIGNLANVALNYVFIIRMQWAAAGAGAASMLSQYLMLAVGLVLFVRLGAHVPWRWSELLERGRLGAMFRLNRDIVIRTLCLVSAFAIFTNISSQLGTALLAVNSILHRLMAVASYLIDGAAYGSETLAGILHGRGERDGLRRLFRLSLATGLGFALLVLAIFFALPRPILSVLTSHGDIIEMGLAYLPWLIPVLLLGSLAYMYDGLFLGLTAGRSLRNAMLVSTLLVFLPLALAAAHLGSNALLWAAMAIFMGARTATLAIASRRFFRVPAA
jgi:MATE family multidrug resistance protein